MTNRVGKVLIPNFNRKFLNDIDWLIQPINIITPVSIYKIDFIFSVIKAIGSL